ncbi:MAG: enterochelin esterase-like enzyme [Rhodothermales bacterium]|jgi:enterochelin esterase-like enzyme
MNRLTVFLLLLSVIGLAGCSDKDGSDQQDTITGHKIRVTAMVPEDAPTVYLTGNLPVLGPWDPAIFPMDGKGARRTATVSVEPGFEFEYKFTLGSWDHEGLGPSGTVMPNFRLIADSDQSPTHEIVDFKRDTAEYLADTTGSGVKGRLVYWTDVASEFLIETRHVEIWLPEGYDDNPTRRYRVLYMHDGQNLFDPRLANTGVDWGIDEAMSKGVNEGLFEPAIVVGLWNTSRRLQEYSPWHDGPSYAQFLTEELMPRIDAEFRTLTGPEDTFTMGSSMGGLISFYLVKEHPDEFSACGCVSSHFPLSPNVLASLGEAGSDADTTPYVVRDIADGDTMPAGARLFFDYGSEGLDTQYGPTHEAIREWLLGEGRQEGRDFQIREYDGATHSEASWRARMGDQLEWLLKVD